MTRNTTAQKIARRTGLLAALASLALTVAPAAGMAKAPVKFGAKLNSTVQPSNSLPGLPATAPKPRSRPARWSSTKPTAAPTAASSPRRPARSRGSALIAGGPGSFRLMAVKQHQRHRRPRSPSATARGSATSGQIESAEEEGDYRVESFTVDMPIKKGEQLALRGSITSMIRCSSGGDNTLIYTPPLFLGGSSPRPATPTAAGC